MADDTFRAPTAVWLRPTEQADPAAAASSSGAAKKQPAPPRAASQDTTKPPGRGSTSGVKPAPTRPPHSPTGERVALSDTSTTSGLSRVMMWVAGTALTASLIVAVIALLLNPSPAGPETRPTITPTTVSTDDWSNAAVGTCIALERDFSPSWTIRSASIVDCETSEATFLTVARVPGSSEDAGCDGVEGTSNLDFADQGIDLCLSRSYEVGQCVPVSLPVDGRRHALFSLPVSCDAAGEVFYRDLTYVVGRIAATEVNYPAEKCGAGALRFEVDPASSICLEPPT